MVHLGLTGGVGDLAVVKNNGVTSSTLIEVPANALGELGVRVGKEELLSLSLAPDIYTHYTEIRGRTMSSFLTLLALPQALMTKASL